MGAKKRKERKPNTKKNNGATHGASRSKGMWLGVAAAAVLVCLFIVLLIRRQSESPSAGTSSSTNPSKEAREKARMFYNKAMTLLYDNHVQQSLQYFDECIKLNPQNIDCYNSKAGALRMLGKSKAALDTLKTGESRITNTTHLAQLYSSSFLILKDLRQPHKAVEYIQRSIELHPTAIRYYNWATLETSHAKQVELYTQALKVDPNYFPAFCSRFDSYYNLGEWELIEQDYNQTIQYQQALIDQDAQQKNTNSSSCLLPYYTTYMDIPPQLMKETTMQYAKRQATMSNEGVLPQLKPSDISPVFDENGKMIRKLRIGYVSSDLNIHPVGRNVLGLFMAHDTNKFDVIAFSTKHSPNDEITNVIMNTPQVTYVDVSRVNGFEKLAKMIRDEYHIDVLVDLNGWTEGNVLKMFGARPAPVQMTHGLGFVGSVGSPSFDYLITDAIVSPQRFDEYYTESLIRLPQAYLPASHATVLITPLGNKYNPATANKTQLRIENKLPTDSFVFCNFQGIRRIGRASFETWLRILQQTPKSVLWMAQRSHDLREKLLQRATDFGIENASSRILFSDTVNPGLHLVRAQACDLHLDSWPYTAHSTAVDMLWAGVPILTYLSDYHDDGNDAVQVPKMASRVAASLLDTLGMPQLVASSIEDYEKDAVEYATNRVSYEKLRNELLNKRLTSPLFDLISYARVHEDAYLKAFQRFMSGMPPEPIDIEPYQLPTKQQEKASDGMNAKDEL